MKFALDDLQQGLVIDAYTDSEIVVGGRRVGGSLMIGPDMLSDDGLPDRLDALEPSHFDALAAMDLQVVLLGTGSVQQFPRPALYANLLKQGIGVEVMSTASACRTYNILLGEGRRVGALLLLDGGG